MDTLNNLVTGRVTRKDMLGATVIWLLSSIPLFADFDVVNFYADATTSLTPKIYFFILWALILFAWSTILGIKRLHDIGLSGYWILMTFVPYVALGLLLYLVFKQQVQGENQYGPQPIGFSWRRVFLVA